jgi:hypothetical protein
VRATFHHLTGHYLLVAHICYLDAKRYCM